MVSLCWEMAPEAAPACPPPLPPGHRVSVRRSTEHRGWKLRPPGGQRSQPLSSPSRASRRGGTAKALAPDSWALLPGVRRELGTKVRWGPRGRKGLHRSVDLGRPGRRKPGTAPRSLSSFNTATASSLRFVPTPSPQPSSFLPPSQAPHCRDQLPVCMPPPAQPFALCRTETGATPYLALSPTLVLSRGPSPSTLGLHHF